MKGAHQVSVLVCYNTAGSNLALQFSPSGPWSCFHAPLTPVVPVLCVALP